MALHIKRGLVTRPQRVVLYAPEGLGKSTLASQLANPLFLDFEKGTHHLDVARLEPTTLAEVETCLAELAKDTQGFESLVIDTIDWLEELVIADICKAHKKSGIEDFGYGKGYTVLCERFGSLLGSLDRVAAKMHVVCLAHSHVKRLELPETPPFDHYELKLSKQVAPLVREWCDALLFGNWKTIVKIGDNDHTKLTANSGKERRLFCSHTSIADAKNRHELGDEEPWSLATLQRIMKQVSRAVPSSAVETPPSTGVGTCEAVEKADAIPGIAPENGGPNELHPVLVATCEAHDEAVNKFLVSRQQIKVGQTWRDLSPDYVARIVANPARFLEFVHPQQKGAA